MMLFGFLLAILAAVRTAWTGTAAVGEVFSAADAKSIPGGWIGYAEATANQTLTNTATETDLTGLTVTVTVAANRKIRITGQGILSRSVADGVTVGRIKEGSTELGRWAQHAPSATTEFDDAMGSAISSPAGAFVTPSAGSHTYKLTLQRFSGTGNVTLNAAAGSQAYILVEDLGPAS